MLTLALIAIIGALAIPGYQFTLQKILLRREISALKQGLMLAQHLAQQHQTDILICASHDGKHCAHDWSKGFMLLDSERAQYPRHIYWVHHNGQSKHIHVTFNRGDAITFHHRHLEPTPFGTFTLKNLSSTQPETKIVINRVGRIII